MHCWWECKLVLLLWKFLKILTMEIPQKIKKIITELLYDTAILFLGILIQRT